MTWSAAAVRNLKFFFLCRWRGGCADFLSAARRLESLQMKNSFQNKKNICLFRYLNVNLFKKL
jgi:hypothetical protein